MECDFCNRLFGKGQVKTCPSKVLQAELLRGRQANGIGIVVCTGANFCLVQ